MPDSSDKPGAQSGSRIIERKLATILSADVAEFSRLMNEDEEQALRTFRGHKKIFESLVVTHHGRVFNTAGDAILAEFASAVEAVRCATDVQSALRTRNDQLPPSRQVRFRIGINLGDVMIQAQDLLGDGVNIAARLQTAAEPGGICISGSVHDQIRNKLSLAFHSLGERNYKNIPQPVRTFSIVEAESGEFLPSPKRPSVWKSPTVCVPLGLLILAGVAYMAYSIHEHTKSETARAPMATAPPASPLAPSSAPSPAPSPESRPSAEGFQRAQPAEVVGIPAAKSDRAAGKEPLSESSESTATSVAANRGYTTAPVAPLDGVYSGPVCYGKTPMLPARCYPAQGTVRGDKITGTWRMPNEPGVTMSLEGKVSPSGEVTIIMHSDNAAGVRVTTINLTGKITQDSLDANGHFLRGRAASLRWHVRSDRLH